MKELDTDVHHRHGQGCVRTKAEVVQVLSHRRQLAAGPTKALTFAVYARVLRLVHGSRMAKPCPARTDLCKARRGAAPRGFSRKSLPLMAEINQVVHPIRVKGFFADAWPHQQGGPCVLFWKPHEMVDVRHVLRPSKVMFYHKKGCGAWMRLSNTGPTFFAHSLPHRFLVIHT